MRRIGFRRATLDRQRRAGRAGRRRRRRARRRAHRRHRIDRLRRNQRSRPRAPAAGATCSATRAAATGSAGRRCGGGARGRRPRADDAADAARPRALRRRAASTELVRADLRPRSAAPRRSPRSAPLVARARADGDAVAAEILRAPATSCARGGVGDHAARHARQRVSIVLAGGIFRVVPWLADDVSAARRSGAAHARVARSTRAGASAPCISRWREARGDVPRSRRTSGVDERLRA